MVLILPSKEDGDAPEGLATVGDRRLDGGDVAVLGQDGDSLGREPAATVHRAIHIYGGDFFGTPPERLGDGARGPLQHGARAAGLGRGKRALVRGVCPNGRSRLLNVLI